MIDSKQYRADFEARWDELAAQGEREKNPYLAYLTVADRIAQLGPDSDELHAIDDIFTDWLLSEDVLRWQPALASLTQRRVKRAAPVIRQAAAKATSDTKVRFRDTFLRNAAKIDAD